MPHLITKHHNVFVPHPPQSKMQRSITTLNKNQDNYNQNEIYFLSGTNHDYKVIGNEYTICNHKSMHVTTREHKNVLVPLAPQSCSITPLTKNQDKYKQKGNLIEIGTSHDTEL